MGVRCFERVPRTDRPNAQLHVIARDRAFQQNRKCINDFVDGELTLALVAGNVWLIFRPCRPSDVVRRCSLSQLLGSYGYLA